jgi:hypothetical protein
LDAVRIAELETRRRRDAELLLDRQRERDARAATRQSTQAEIAELRRLAEALPPDELGSMIAAIADPFLRELCERDPLGPGSLSFLAAGLRSAAQPVEGLR